MEINYEKLKELSISDLGCMKDKASVNLSIASVTERQEDVDYFTCVMNACIKEMNVRMNIIFTPTSI